MLHDYREKHLPGAPLKAQEKAIVIVFFIFIIILVGGIVTVITLETRNLTECGGAITNTPNAPKPQPPS